MSELEFEKPDEIRCAYCLSWNSKEKTICKECTTVLFDATEIGAARALVSWENVDPLRIKYSFASEKSEKITYWNSAFQTQFEFFQKEYSHYNFLSKYALLDIQDEVEKYFLSQLPMRPEVFKEFKEYEFPENSKNEIELLNFTFRTHPAPIFRALAALSLIQMGRAEDKILHYIHNWDAHYKILKREKLLSFAHWSVQRMDGFKQYNSFANDIMPLYNSDDKGKNWAKIFLYKANYEVQELKYELEDLIISGKLHLAISACFALRKFDKIKDLLVGRIDESTIDLAVVYSDERHIPNLLMFLKFAPRKYHETIIRRCVQVKPTDLEVKNQIVEWLLNQSNVVLLEVLFGWSEIPQFELVMTKLLNESEGIQSLKSFFSSWYIEFKSIKSDNLAIQQLLAYKNSSFDSNTQQMLLDLKEKVQDLFFESLCEEVKKKRETTKISELLTLLFKPNSSLNQRQISDAFHSLIRVAENTKSFDTPYFVFQKSCLQAFSETSENFHKFLKFCILNADYQRSACNWLFAIYDMLITTKTDFVFENELFTQHCYVVLDLIYHQQIDVGTSCKFFSLLVNCKSTFTLDQKITADLNKISSTCNDFEMKYWIEQLVGSSSN